MSRRARSDVIVVGGGVVGAACALGLARRGLDVVLVEGQAPAPWSAQTPDLRVYAFAPDNAALLQRLGVWDAVRGARAQPYRRMRVWDAAGGGELVFDADRLGRRELGWLIEHGLLADRLWAALPAAGVQLRCPARVEAMEQDATGVRLTLDDGARLEARLAIAADGAASTLRQLAGLGTQGHDYGQQGVVGYIRSERPHEDTAWQRFLPTGPLAVLPCTQGRSSIVWTLPQAEAARVLALEEAAFSRELTLAFGGRLGELVVDSPRAAFPLRLQLAREYVEGRVLLLGDAAHAVHPLAGQGVNLGLRDVAGLLDSVAQAQARQAPWDGAHRLQRWARTRLSENTVAAYTFHGINRLFSTDELHTTLARGPLLGLAGRLPPLTDLLWRRAAGL
ncbi:UbiH/UbiF family hydroxylase [Pseudoxanthomonas winnipegensis]|jgi:2-octaprenyl-3-methyl-6-methoxy-1,4-benzoquinol hydroxylase|uniref:UbiH/UbiF family hydroxylase n=1 Tax=Pseudoxanthomonas winnipegensis TaxID=2480810 RepID=A0A4Q8LFE0_9GAMM|nr:UbiH/UbiF family hydroxylase [Pseudoxanthomonas winnipegensis]TAA28120.1 UbiH/UbiF family hydroxylase [Pseudoxanthomonas winnipegensis]